ncbi:MAG TPA: mechanosensitive ion channel family protein [Thermoanaerobaculia bacterium]|nr:mechanosensitive ion channel family protein [Thermoanaerobaculia bacterium]
MQIAWPRWASWVWAGHPLEEWIRAAAITLVLLLILAVVKRVIGARLARFAPQTETQVDDFVVEILDRTRWLLVALPVVYLGSLALGLSPKEDRVVRSAAVLALLVQLALWGLVALDFWLARYRRRRDDAASATMITAFSYLGKVVLWSVVFLLALDNLGIDVTALLTGLGVGGIAVALAVQRILGDILASLSIVMDKPFVVGESITVGDVTGTVERIGIKTTHLRSVGGEQVILPNGDLLQSRIRNWARMTERRVVLAFTLDPSTPAGVVAEIPAAVRSFVEAQTEVRFDRAHFKGFGGLGLDFEAVYWILRTDYGAFMDRQQAVGLALLRWLEERGAVLASSSRVLPEEPATSSPSDP